MTKTIGFITGFSSEGSEVGIYEAVLRKMMLDYIDTSSTDNMGLP